MTRILIVIAIAIWIGIGVFQAHSTEQEICTKEQLSIYFDCLVVMENYEVSGVASVHMPTFERCEVFLDSTPENILRKCDERAREEMPWWFPQR